MCSDKCGNGIHVHVCHGQMGHSVVWLQREAAEGQLCSSPPSLFSDSLPWWLSPGSSVWSPAAANKPTGDINQRGGVPVSAAATNVHLFR